MFNHLLAATEAFVAAHLWDFPTDLRLEALPSGDLMAGVRLRW